MSDKELVSRCIQKDPLAWNEFVGRYSGLVHWAIQNRLKKWDYMYQPEDIEEIHQNVFLSLWKKDKLEQVKNHEKIAGWLIIVSGNEAVSYFRSRKLQLPPGAISIFEKIIIKDQALTLADILPFFQKNPLSEKEAEDAVMASIEALAPKEKIMLKLNMLYKKKYREIAEMMNMPLGTVCTMLKNIKFRLKKSLREGKT
jgi:RNA polymerase sigma-70 factor (ECF subfamily)